MVGLVRDFTAVRKVSGFSDTSSWAASQNAGGTKSMGCALPITQLKVLLNR